MLLNFYPPHVERILAQLIMKVRPYQGSVTFLDDPNMMEATVVSCTDPTVRRQVVLRMTEHITPSCSSFSTRSGNGGPQGSHFHYGRDRDHTN